MNEITLETLGLVPAAPTFQPTPEQAVIVEAARTTTENIQIAALAGAAKTTTLELIARALPSVPILSIAFNKRIADEMKKRLPSHVLAATINSVGHKVWAAACAKRLNVNTKKSYEILKQLVDALPREARADAYENFSDTLKAIGTAKLNGYVPEGKFPNANHLINREQLIDLFEDPDYVRFDLLDEALNTSIRMAYDGQIDFDDQIYMPTLFGGTFPKFPLVLVDEAQDLSPLNHAMLDKLVTKRIIAVGDAFQSIYGFRGADTNSMARLRNRFQMTELPLSISFRCPREIVRAARFRAPHMQWPDWAIEGEIHDPPSWSASTIPDGAAIICRNNAPLFSAALQLLRFGRGVKLVGTDLGPQLTKILKKLGPETLSRAETLHAIDRWETERLQKSRSPASVTDKADCLRVFANFGDTLSAAIAYAEHLFSAGGPIQLLSGHKAKGLEWDVVYHLDPWRIPSKYAVSPAAQEQEMNLRYVILTRAKRILYNVNLEDLSQ